MDEKLDELEEHTSYFRLRRDSLVFLRSEELWHKRRLASDALERGYETCVDEYVAVPPSNLPPL